MQRPAPSLIAMNETAHQQPRHFPAGILSLIAAASAVSVIVVGNQGASASRYAISFVGLLALILFSVLVYIRPVVTVVVALIFLTSPIPLVLSLPQSALVSASLLAAATLGFLLRTPMRSMVRDPLFLPIGIFLAYGVVSAAYGLAIGNDLNYVLGDCFQVIEFALVYFLVAQLMADPAVVRVALRFWLASILTTILVELLLFALGSSALLPAWEGSVELVRTIDIDATILFAVLINLYPVARARRQRLWIWIALVPTVANIALSLSRGLWVCTVVAVIVSLALQARRLRRQLLKVFALVSLCAMLLAAMWQMGSGGENSLLSVFEERVSHGVDQMEWGLAGDENMATRRFLEMAIVAPQVLAKPWIGHGLGATYVIGGFAVLDVEIKGPIDNHFIHNLYLVTAFRMGLIGLGLLLWLLVRYLRITLKGYRDIHSDMDKALVVGFVASVVGQLVLSMTQPTVLDHPTCALIACAMALSFRLTSPTPAYKQQNESKHGV
jgi:hypothetical protein